MARVGTPAPRFGGQAVVGDGLAWLSWEQLHDGRALALLFDPSDRTTDWPEYLIAVSNAVARLGRPHARVVVVWRNSPCATLDWARRPRARGGPGPLAFPLIADPLGEVAARYGLWPADAPLWARFLIDPAGLVREAAVTAFPARPAVDDLLRAVHAVTSPADAGL